MTGQNISGGKCFQQRLDVIGVVVSPFRAVRDFAIWPIRCHWKVCFSACCWCALTLLSFLARADDSVTTEIQVDFLMDSDPHLEPPPALHQFPRRCKALWLEALDRPEADLQQMAARTIARAHALGMEGLADAMPALLRLVGDQDTRDIARFAAAEALIALDARTSAPVLFEASQRYGGNLRQLVEPALAQWSFQPAVPVWRERLTTQRTRHRDLLLAIRGLGSIGDPAAALVLCRIVNDRFQPAAIRIEAARSAGRITDAGLESIALRLLEIVEPTIADRICAGALLERHSSHEAQTVFLNLARDPEPSVAALALNRLLEIDPPLAVPIAREAMHNVDANVRRKGADTYLACPSPQRIISVAQLLDDPDPALRAGVRDQLYRLAQKREFDPILQEAVMAVLKSASWRGQEQATLLLGALEYKPAAAEMVALLESPRAEVMIAAAWGLRKLAVAETLPAILDKATRQTQARIGRLAPMEVDLQVAHLLEAMGMQQYAPAEPLFRRYVPKNPMMGEYSRAAAIWSLTRSNAGDANVSLAKLFVERLTDSAPPPMGQPQESMRVKVMCAIALARMRATPQVERMAQYFKTLPATLPSSLAIRWALQELTGNRLPDPEPAIVRHTDWFLTPLENQLDE